MNTFLCQRNIVLRTGDVYFIIIQRVQSLILLSRHPLCKGQETG
jgi:hypothetical protein